METVELVKNNNREARIQKDDFNYYRVTRMINIDQVLWVKEFKTFAGAMRYATNHVNS